MSHFFAIFSIITIRYQTFQRLLRIGQAASKQRLGSSNQSDGNFHHTIVSVLSAAAITKTFDFVVVQKRNRVAYVDKIALGLFVCILRANK